MRFRTLFILIFCNLIWSAHPLMGKYLLLGFDPEQGAWLRYTSAMIAYSLVALLLRCFGRTRQWVTGPLFLVPRTLRDAAWIALLGFSAFCFSPLLQMTGLASSRALDNSLIVALEPLMTVMLAWLILRERPTRLHFGAFGVALIGFTFLTGMGPAMFQDAHFVGNLLMFSSLIGEALYSSLARKLIVRHRPNAVFGSAIVIGVLGLTLATSGLSTFPSWHQISTMPGLSALGLLWVGPFGTGLSYLLWINALQEAPVASLALTLFIQPVLGPVWGWLFLGERLNGLQGLGSVLILIAVFGQTWGETRKVEREDRA